MNRIYSLVFNRTLGRVQVASELAARSHGGVDARPRRVCLPATLAMALALAGGSAWAQVAPGQLPTGEHNLSGIDGIDRDTANALMTIRQGTKRAAIDWNSFDVGTDALVRILQSSDAALLNRVTGGDISQILGRIEAPGEVFLVNSAGVLFRDGAQVNVGGLVASSLDVNRNAFLGQEMLRLDASTQGAVVNQGSLLASDGGNIMLLGSHVSNSGRIDAPHGSVTLAAGDRIVISQYHDSVTLEVGTAAALVENHGRIQADAGNVLLTARAIDDTLQTIINNTGTVRARSLGELAGSIEIVGHSSGGAIEVAGLLDTGAQNTGNDWSAESTITLQAHHDIQLDADIIATEGRLTLDAGNHINASGAIDVGTFEIVNGDWRQINTSLAAFSAGDFRIGGGSFLRVAGGVGSVENPYLLTDVYGLQGMKSFLSSHFALNNHIDASGTGDWSRRFVPIGDNLTDADDSRFTGSLDGRGHTISDLSIATGATYTNAGGVPFVYAGLFGRTGAGSRIRNLGLENVSVRGEEGSYVTAGALVGFATGTLIENTYATGAVTASSSNIAYAGGLVGRSSSHITNSYANVEVSSLGTGAAGGLVGLNHTNSIVEQSYASGRVLAGAIRGGLVGTVSNLSDIRRSFYATTDASGSTINGGGATGPQWAGNAFGSGKAWAELTKLETFAAWGADIDGKGGTGSTWRIYEGHTTPLLRSFLTPLSVTAQLPGKTYDGAIASGIAAFVTSIANAELGGSLAYSTSSGNAGTYQTSAGSLRLSGLHSDQSGYDIAYADSSLTIDPRAITITADSFAKVYGNADPTLTWSVTEGNLVGGDTLAGALTREAGENVGSYAIDASALVNGNYVVTAVDGVLTIDPRAITVTADSFAKVYGNADPTLTWSVTEGNLVGDDTLAGALTREAGENVGSYAIDASALANGNYVVTAIDGVLTIDPRAITITADSLAKVYGNADPTLTWSVTEGNLVGGDTLVGALTREAGENVGSYAIDASALANGNYVVTAVDGVLTIDKASLTITALDAFKPIGRALTPTAHTVEGLRRADTVDSVQLRSAGTPATATPGQYDIDVSNAIGTGLDNYVITYVEGTLQVGVADRALADATAREQRGQRPDQPRYQKAATTVPAAGDLFNVDGAGMRVPPTAHCAPEWPAHGCADRAPD